MLFQLSCSSKVEPRHACLPPPLKLCLALVKSNYHLLLVSGGGTLLAPSLLSLCTFLSPSVFSYIVLATLRGLSHFSCPRIGAHYANSETSGVIAQHGGNKREPLVFHYTDTCQAGFSLIREDAELTGMIRAPHIGPCSSDEGTAERAKEAH